MDILQGLEDPFTPKMSSANQIPPLKGCQTRGLAFPRLPELRWFTLVFLALGLAFTKGAEPTINPHTNSFAGSPSCRECHPKFYELWSTSFHGLAMQPYTPQLAKQALTPQTNEVVAAEYRFRADIEKGVVIEKGPKGVATYPIAQVTGGKNVYYFLTQMDRGWLQVLPVAYDVRRKEWFDTTASAMRHFGDREDEALYWKERQLTFNTSCYNCHVSQMRKNYDLRTDSYQTTWGEPGINCETCHGPSLAHVQLFRHLPTNQPAPADVKLIVTRKLSTAQRNDMCAPCHAKMSPLTDAFAPGDRYFDHFDLVTLEHADFYPDGRDLGENYTFTQWRMSPCAKSGQLDCVHCHTSSGRYRFHEPEKANHACLPCHDDKVANAAAHTRHKAGSKGNECISCHMPMTEFARMRRSDHSMRPPAPSATLAYHSPNACNLCHTTNSAAWADKWVREWRPRDFQKPMLEMAALVDAARKRDWRKLPAILAYLSRPERDRDEIQTTSLTRLLADCPDKSKWPVIRQLATADSSPLVRASAADALSQDASTNSLASLRAATKDAYRLVRARAGSSLAAVPTEMIPESDQPQVRVAVLEHLASLQARPDDMASHYNVGNYHMARGEMPTAIAAFETALRLQPDALPPRVNVSLAYNALGQNDKAEASLRSALRQNPTNAAVNLNMGMLLAEMGKPTEAEQAFRTAAKSDPKSAQAAFNLGLLISKRDPVEGLEWCQKAAGLVPQEPKYAFTVAYLLQQQSRISAAILTLEAALTNSPAYPDSYALLAQLYQRTERVQDAANVCRRAADDTRLPISVRQQFTDWRQQLSGK